MYFDCLYTKQNNLYFFMVKQKEPLCITGSLKVHLTFVAQPLRSPYPHHLKKSGLPIKRASRWNKYPLKLNHEKFPLLFHRPYMSNLISSININQIGTSWRSTTAFIHAIFLQGDNDSIFPMTKVQLSPRVWRMGLLRNFTELRLNCS